MPAIRGARVQLQCAQVTPSCSCNRLHCCFAAGACTTLSGPVNQSSDTTHATRHMTRAASPPGSVRSTNSERSATVMTQSATTGEKIHRTTRLSRGHSLTASRTSRRWTGLRSGVYQTKPNSHRRLRRTRYSRVAGLEVARRPRRGLRHHRYSEQGHAWSPPTLGEWRRACEATHSVSEPESERPRISRRRAAEFVLGGAAPPSFRAVISRWLPPRPGTSLPAS
mmetsp:Transcript_52029/g.145130  ORF Transcript_52029/g.145130 Transcript_52029/m.145130 type:complete len:224 (+) Transcript_52029:326-997(+)